MRPADLLLNGIYRAASVSSEQMEAPGTSISDNPARAGTGMVVVYQFDHHTLIWCDPEQAGLFAELVGGSPTREPEIRAFAAGIGFESVGAAVMKTLPELRARSVPEGTTLHRFDWTRPHDTEIMQRLVDASSEEALDESEVAMDDLDDVAVGLLDAGGEVVAFASMRPFDYAETLGDIGVLVADSHQRRGLGAAVVSKLVETALPDGWDALYRCDPYDNPGSDRLSASIGFEPVTDLVAFKKESDPT